MKKASKLRLISAICILFIVFSSSSSIFADPLKADSNPTAKKTNKSSAKTANKAAKTPAKSPVKNTAKARPNTKPTKITPKTKLAKTTPKTVVTDQQISSQTTNITFPNIVPDPSNMSDTRRTFLQAEAALNSGKMEIYQNLKPKLLNYPLFPYLLYTEYDRKIPNLTLNEFSKFMEQYSDTPLAEQLRSHYLQNTAKQEDWSSFLKAYVPTEDLSLQCHFLWAELHNQSNKDQVLEQVQPLWLRGKEPPKSCQALFKTWESSRFMTHALVWQRTKLAIQEGNERLARSMEKYLNKSEIALVELWIMVSKNPYLVTQSKYFTEKHPAILEMIVHGVSEIAKTKPDAAIHIWQRIGKQYAFSERHWGLVVRAIGLTFSNQRHPDAEKWLKKVPNVCANPAVHESRIRIAVGREDWQTVLHWVKQLPSNLLSQEIWLYWQARALEKVNRLSEAQIIFQKLAQTRSYYGFLASQKLSKPYSIAHQKFSLENEFLITIAKKPCLLRARELLILGREAKARSEWIYATQLMSDKERHGAASLALKWNQPNWSILALSKAVNKDDLELRFPIVHSQPIYQEARKNQIDPALVFALTRQESAFVHNAKSSAGALGLMQLMPSTASLVAKKHQVQIKGTKSLLDPHTNIKLGTKYFRMMLDAHENHHILATAAYNAGPGRIKKWLPSYDMSADAWIETIPYKETREYVKNIMTYTVIYQQLLGYKPRLAAPLPHIPAAK